MNNKLRILEMIENKTITATEAAKLLKATDENEKTTVLKPEKSAFKMFKIKVLSGDGDKVNVQIPIEFAKVALSTGKGFMKMDQIEGLNLDIDQILQMVETGMLGKIVDIESADGDKVEIIIE